MTVTVKLMTARKILSIGMGGVIKEPGLQLFVPDNQNVYLLLLFYKIILFLKKI